jgi:hypothetical protein
MEKTYYYIHYTTQYDAQVPYLNLLEFCTKCVSLPADMPGAETALIVYKRHTQRGTEAANLQDFVLLLSLN